MVAVFMGGLLGSAARGLVALVIPHPVDGFPVGVLIVNLIGSFFLGYLISLRAVRSVLPAWTVHFWAIGVLGSFTTFSTFSLDLVVLLDAGHPALALGYGVASLVGGLGLAVLGLRAGRR
jgi:fluoride exporter